IPCRQRFVHCLQACIQSCLSNLPGIGQALHRPGAAMLFVLRLLVRPTGPAVLEPNGLLPVYTAAVEMSPMHTPAVYLFDPPSAGSLVARDRLRPLCARKDTVPSVRSAIA